ncbi:MAG: tetratricopeptide repeat protein, partial [Acidobacteriota bacterium]
RTDEAARRLGEALEIRRRALPEDHWLIAVTASALGACETARGRFAEAERLLLDSYRTLAAQRGEANFRTREAHQRLVELYDAWGQPERAAEYRATATSP